MSRDPFDATKTLRSHVAASQGYEPPEAESGGIGYAVLGAGALLLGGLLAFKLFAPGAGRTPLPSGSRVLLVGDSLAVGLAAPLAALASPEGITIAGAGRTGTRIDQWASEPWLATAIGASLPTAILVSLGTNDMKLSDPTAEQPQLEQLLAALRATGAEVLWIAPPTMAFPDRGVRALIARDGLPVFPSDRLTIPRGGDGIHPTPAGYAAWAQAIWAWVQGRTA